MEEQHTTTWHLEAGEVHVWAHRRPATGCSENLSLLSKDERERAARFQFPHLAAAFVDIHGWMRRVLAAYVGARAETLVFVFNSFGKPTLVPGPVMVDFNLSHTTGLALLAIARGAELGIDVETLRRIEEAEAIAETHFSPAEQQALGAASAAERDRIFLRCWTRKEALLKAWGTGISTNLASFTVSTSSDHTAALLHCNQHPEKVGVWTLTPLEVGTEHLAALAFAGPARRVRYFSGLENAC